MTEAVTDDCVVTSGGGVTWVRLAPPHLTAPMAGALSDACADVAGDPAVHVLVLAGLRPGAFLSGAQLADEAEHVAAAACVAAIAALRPVTLAVIDGPAHGAGLELALACDLRLATTRATFAIPQLGEGVMPFLGGTQRLPRIVGRARALDMLLTGRVLDAAEATAVGLVVRVVLPIELDTAVAGLIDSLLAAAPLARGLAKEALAAALDVPLAEGLRLEEDLYALLQTSEDRAEGVRAFLEGRTPRFTGR